MQTELANDELLITRTFAAPASLLFALWSEPEHLKRWMGPHDFDCPHAEVDFRVGGAYRVLIKSATHGDNWFGGVYREIEPGRRLVFTFAWDNDGPSAGLETIVTLTFAERDGRTVQTFHQARFPQCRAPRQPHGRLEPGIRQAADLRRTDHERTSSMITISAFEWVPDFAQGFVRDLRVRWALEEAGLPYRARLLTQGDRDTPEYRAAQPFGQVPIFEEDGLTLFESGAIVLHVGQRSEALLPKEPEARARATQWLICALNSIEPCVGQLVALDIFYKDEEWARLRRPSLDTFVRRRIGSLSAALGEKPYLDGDRFTAGDLLMTTVLRDLGRGDILASDKRLSAYVDRCMARPAFKRAHAAQLGDFKAAA